MNNLDTVQLADNWAMGLIPDPAMDCILEGFPQSLRREWLGRVKAQVKPFGVSYGWPEKDTDDCDRQTADVQNAEGFYGDAGYDHNEQMPLIRNMVASTLEPGEDRDLFSGNGTVVVRMSYRLAEKLAREGRYIEMLPAYPSVPRTDAKTVEPPPDSGIQYPSVDDLIAWRRDYGNLESTVMQRLAEGENVGEMLEDSEIPFNASHLYRLRHLVMDHNPNFPVGHK